MKHYPRVGGLALVLAILAGAAGRLAASCPPGWIGNTLRATILPPSPGPRPPATPTPPAVLAFAWTGEPTACGGYRVYEVPDKHDLHDASLRGWRALAVSGACPCLTPPGACPCPDPPPPCPGPCPATAPCLERSVARVVPMDGRSELHLYQLVAVAADDVTEGPVD